MEREFWRRMERGSLVGEQWRESQLERETRERLEIWGERKREGWVAWMWRMVRKVVAKIWWWREVWSWSRWFGEREEVGH